MEKKRKLQIRILLFIVRLIDGIHLKDEYKKELDNIIEDLKKCDD